MASEVPADPDQNRSDLTRLVSELRQRHLFRIAAAYAVAAWLIIQVVDVVGPAFDLPPWVLRAVILAAMVGFLATTGFLLFQPRRESGSRLPIYLSQRMRLIAGAAILLVAVAAAALSIKSMSDREQVSLAVLPFADLSPARDKAYFAEGVAEEILSTLAAERQIKVLGRTSARQIEGDPDPQAIRASLGVTHLLEGSTRTAGDQLRVNVRLIDTADGTQLWEEEYRGKLADVFAVQDQIASTVVKRLRGTFFGGEVREARQTAIDAYQTYLAARALMRTRSEESLKQALALASQVVEADPDYAPGRALLAELVFLLSDDAESYGTIPLEKARRIAIPQARKAIALAPKRAEGYGALGLILPADEAIEPLQHAIRLDPARGDLRIWLGVALSQVARDQEALQAYRSAYEIEPLWPVALNRLNQALAASGKYPEALAEIARFRQRGGAEAQALRFLATIHWSRGELAKSIATRRKALAADPSLPYQRGSLGYELYMLGFKAAAKRVIPRDSSYARTLIVEGSAPLLARARGEATTVWSRPDPEVAVFALASARDWPALVRLHDQLSASGGACALRGSTPALLALALVRSGRVGAGRDILECLNARWSKQAGDVRAPGEGAGVYELGRASAAAVSGDRNAALSWLRRAVDRGFLGEFTPARLAEYPQFEVIADDPRLAQLQRRIEQRIAQQRAEVRTLVPGQLE